MGDKMHPLPFETLLNWVRTEYERAASIFGIPETRFYRKQGAASVDLFGRPCAMPLGPAAGPHTQLAPNLVAAFLAGGRFMELKTVQILDTLEIPKPCIDAEGEGYNTEWSTELTVEQALEEYLKAWAATHLLQKVLFQQEMRPGFVYNLSVGYTLEGIRSPKIDAFIEGLKDASRHPVFRSCVDRIVTGANRGEFDRMLERNGLNRGALEGIEAIPPDVCGSVALSTMHGCPPADIEAICRYLLAEKKLDTFVKLNPTLLGHDFVLKTLHDRGYRHIGLREHSFTHDLQYPDALAMLRRLAAFAAEQGRRFGIKLSNTLAVVNAGGALPGDEMYMSGRALYPLTITLAARLAAEFDGRLPISYSGGADAFNLGEIFACGVRPVTLATDLLKPGGYLRMAQLAEQLDAAPEAAWEMDRIDAERLGELARSAVGPSREGERKSARAGMKTRDPLPLFDCAMAPCVANCPIRQDVPEYARLLSRGLFAEALDLIASRNPLPHITGTICDHQCMAACARNDYESPVRIRDLKLAAAVNGASGFREAPAAAPKDVRVAVVGAGPSGLAAACFLARGGLRVTVFDRLAEAGGTVRHVIPRFRIAPEAIAKDIDHVRRFGVEFAQAPPEDLTVEKLRARGFAYVYLAVGAARSNPLPLDGDPARVRDAVEFLLAFNQDASALDLGRSVVVVGGGNSAMDGARAALRVPGVERVTLVYRRTEAQMPADREEFDNALADGVAFRELRVPVTLSADGQLKCQVMTLGEPGRDGRPLPVPVPGCFETLPADTVIAAIGEKVDTDFLRRCGLDLDERGWVKADPSTLETTVPGVFIGGDAWRGPSTVVESIADGRTAAEAILAREGCGLPPSPKTVPEDSALSITCRRGRVQGAAPGELTGTAAVRAEAERCLQCATVCDKCVEVCPNRANVALDVSGDGEHFSNAHQILHLDDFCNECGNCATFCPWDGKPYLDKFTVFGSLDAFRASRNKGFIVVGEPGAQVAWIRLNGEVFERPLDVGAESVHHETPAPEPAMRRALSLVRKLRAELPQMLASRL